MTQWLYFTDKPRKLSRVHAINRDTSPYYQTNAFAKDGTVVSECGRATDMRNFTKQLPRAGALRCGHCMLKVGEDYPITPYCVVGSLEDIKAMHPAEKIRIIEAMGFTPVHDPHQPGCPSVYDPGLLCRCVADPTFWTPPQDVVTWRGETWEERLARAQRR